MTGHRDAPAPFCKSDVMPHVDSVIKWVKGKECLIMEDTLTLSDQNNSIHCEEMETDNYCLGFKKRKVFSVPIARHNRTLVSRSSVRRSCLICNRMILTLIMCTVAQQAPWVISLQLKTASDFCTANCSLSGNTIGVCHIISFTIKLAMFWLFYVKT